MDKHHALPHGAIKAVARDMHVSVSLVSKVARGERRNARIEEALGKKILEHKARLKRIRRMNAKLDELHIDEIDTQ